MESEDFKVRHFEILKAIDGLSPHDALGLLMGAVGRVFDEYYHFKPEGSVASEEQQSPPTKRSP